MKRILGAGVLGVDESNHGRDPEVFVAVYSDNPREIRARDQLLKKDRDNGQLERELKNYDYRFILFSRKFKQYFNEHLIKVIAISEFISYFQNNEQFGNLEKVVFDGELRKQDVDVINAIIEPMPKPIITSAVRGDVTIPLVNRADRAAALLFKYYTKNRGRKSGRYEKYLLTPNLFLYSKLINSINC